MAASHCGGGITHVIFDMDGTLLDTEVVYTRVLTEIAAAYGRRFDWGVKQRMMGRNAIESCTAMVDALQLPITPSELLVLREKEQNAAWPHSQPLPGVVKLVEHLHANDIPLAVATGTTMSSLKLKTQLHQCRTHVAKAYARG
eukprot:TRINITY_DN3454_c0_g1_i4.p3 TRINITY_DN3454_c0_g1~~TRINITY_DN3454_c0_g1_i4.p3  ORF type:complete len:143 (-),score=37.23 TRINITY_DN3454_c0_g1_i4:378-806(-)